MSKLERLLNLTAALLDTERPLTAEELRVRVPGYPEAGPSFRRAFERDKDDLRELGIPLRLEPVPGTDPPIDGYRVPRSEYELADPGLEGDELAALGLAAAAVRVDDRAGREALAKLGGNDDELTRPGPELAAVPTDAALGALFSATVDHHPVRITYRGSDREIDPHRLDFQGGHWYVTGHDHLRDDIRHFRLDRIEGPVQVERDRTFTRPHAEPGLRLRPWQLGGDEPVTARLLVDADQAGWTVRHLGPDAVTERRDDGSVVVELHVTNRQAFVGFVLGFLSHAVVLEPPELRRAVIDHVEGMLR
ncbi:MAG: WYL domain-containing protein [Actinomycetota bacterium]|nr:WYL domain-containing protein [Actinomycetota bacterium]